MTESPYYAELRRQVFESPVNAARGAHRGTPRATFHFNRILDPGERFILYDFVSDIYGIFGQKMQVVSIVDGCVLLTLKFDRTCDLNGVDFRTAIESNRDYHQLFAEYAVKDIYFQGFPKSPNVNQYRIFKDGTPEPV